MASSSQDRSERYLQFNRQGMTVLLLLVIAVGGVCVAMAVWPSSPSWPRAIVPLTIVAGTIVVGLQRTLRGDRWDARAPEARAIADDEWRRENMESARRHAFAIVIGLQLPLALLFAGLPSLQAVVAMAAATSSIGLASLIALFLWFDRDPRDAG